MRKQFHFRPSPGGLYAWDVQRLVALADDLPTEDIVLTDLVEIDENWWYAHESEPTVRSIVEHVRLINDVDLTYPIIVDPDGRLMDGMHRVAKALLLGHTTIAAKRLPELPEPDHTDYQTDDPPRSLSKAPPRLFLMVGLPGAGKTTRARELATKHDALRLTPDDWHLDLFGTSLRADGKRDILEARMITVALRTLRLRANVVLDFGLWGRDERSALRSLATETGASCEVIYMPVDLDVQLARIAEREAAEPGEYFAMPEAEVVAWRAKFEEPDAVELAGEQTPAPPSGYSTWLAWAVERWPTLAADCF